MRRANTASEVRRAVVTERCSSIHEIEGKVENDAVVALQLKAERLVGQNNSLRDKAAELRLNYDVLATKNEQMKRMLENLQSDLDQRAMAICRPIVRLQKDAGLLPSLTVRYAPGSVVSSLQQILPNLFKSALHSTIFFIVTQVGRVPHAVLGRALVDEWKLKLKQATIARGLQRLRIHNLAATHLLFDMGCSSEGIYPEHMACSLDWAGVGSGATRGWEDAVGSAREIVDVASQVIRGRPEGWDAELLFTPRSSGSAHFGSGGSNHGHDQRRRNFPTRSRKRAKAIYQGLAKSTELSQGVGSPLDQLSSEDSMYSLESTALVCVEIFCALEPLVFLCADMRRYICADICVCRHPEVYVCGHICVRTFRGTCHLFDRSCTSALFKLHHFDWTRLARKASCSTTVRANGTDRDTFSVGTKTLDQVHLTFMSKILSCFCSHLMLTLEFFLIGFFFILLLW